MFCLHAWCSTSFLKLRLLEGAGKYLIEFVWYIFEKFELYPLALIIRCIVGPSLGIWKYGYYLVKLHFVSYLFKNSFSTSANDNFLIFSLFIFINIKWLSLAWPSGAAAARVQRVHLHPSISSNGCNAPVLMKNCPKSGHFSVQKGAFWYKKCGTISNFFGGEGSPLYP